MGLDKKIRKEILSYSYWEHFKKAKELALTLPLKHPERVELEKEINKIRELQNKQKIKWMKKKV